MNKFSIIGIIVIAIAIGMIIVASGDASTYVTFEEAARLAEGGRKAKVHVVGTLQKNSSGDIIKLYYDPVKNPNYFSFVLEDEDKQAKEVIYYSPKPQGFERSEQVVVVGSMQGDKFVADMILTKCPSKYQEQEIEM